MLGDKLARKVQEISSTYSTFEIQKWKKYQSSVHASHGAITHISRIDVNTNI